MRALTWRLSVCFQMRADAMQVVFIGNEKMVCDGLRGGSFFMENDDRYLSGVKYERR
jgi:hypothetical protein